MLRMDNKSTISLIKNPMHHDWSKLIDTRFHLIREYAHDSLIEVKFIRTDEQLGDGKLHSKWLGPYHVIDTAPHGAITIQDDDGNTYKLNGQRLKLFLDHNRALDEEIDVIDLVNHAYISN